MKVTINEILNNKSINNIKSSGLFSKVNYKIVDTNNEYKKNIEITVIEQPTGEISAGAGYGTSGQTFNFGIKENNFKGDGTIKFQCCDFSNICKGWT